MGGVGEWEVGVRGGEGWVGGGGRGGVGVSGRGG